MGISSALWTLVSDELLLTETREKKERGKEEFIPNKGIE